MKNTPEIARVGSTDGSALSALQVEKATEWALRHRKRVESLAGLSSLTYPPTLSEDKRNPELWKGAHWRWFLRIHPLPNNRNKPTP